MDERLEKDLLNRFHYHNNPSAIPSHELARKWLYELAEAVAELVPVSREQSLAFTALEEGLFWTNAAIARMDADGNRL